MTGYTTGTGNELTNDGTWTYTYDADGNLTEKSEGPSANTWTYGYNNAGQMSWAKDSATPGGTVLTLATYVYDALGNQIEEDVWTSSTGTVVTRFGWDGNEIWADLNSGNALQTRYIWGAEVNQLVARISSGSVAWFLTDWEGSVRNITDNTGTLQDTITYDGFGNILSETNPSFGGAYKYDGYRQDTATGQYKTPTRFYNAAVGRWDQQDPLGFSAGDANLYRYVGNDTPNAIDPTGLLRAKAPLPTGKWVPVLVYGTSQNFQDEGGVFPSHFEMSAGTLPTNTWLYIGCDFACKAWYAVYDRWGDAKAYLTITIWADDQGNLHASAVGPSTSTDSIASASVTDKISQNGHELAIQAAGSGACRADGGPSVDLGAIGVPIQISWPGATWQRTFQLGTYEWKSKLVKQK